MGIVAILLGIGLAWLLMQSFDILGPFLGSVLFVLLVSWYGKSLWKDFISDRW